MASPQPELPSFATSEVADIGLGLLRSVLDGKPLVQALVPLAARLGANSHSLHLMRYRDGKPTGSQAEGVGVCAEAQAAYSSHWIRHCPRALALRSAPSGIHDAAVLVPLAEWRASRVWTALGRAAGGGYHSLTATLRRAGDSLESLFFHRREDAAPYTAADRALLEAVFPDLVRAVAASERLTAARQGPEEAARRGLEAMVDGIALFDTDRRLVFANAALRRMGALNDGFRLGADGLDMADPALRLALSRAVTAALAAAEGRLGLLESAGSLAIPRPSRRAPFLLQALPVLPGEVAGGFRGAMLRIADGARLNRPSAALLGRMFSLTPAEANLAGAVAAGRTLADHAARRGVSVETARTHMAAIRRKTGCHRQAELTALLARLPG
jgi:DNA-binding CsgD family transcriptional regulator/PAS domain-containing protein